MGLRLQLESSAGQTDASRNLGKDGTLVYLPGLFGKKQQKSVPVKDIVTLGN